MRPLLRFERVKTPGDGELLVEPPASAVGILLADNAQRIESAASYDLGGISLGQLRREARRELFAAAHFYTSRYRDVSFPADLATMADRPFLLAGHQPELFHPGVWVKNFVLSKLAAEHGAIPINLVIDSDLARQTSIRVPSGTLAEPRLEAVEFARRRPDIAYSECTIEDWARFRSFADRAAAAVEPFVAQPLVQPFWQHVVKRAEETNRLAAALAQGRHIWEGNWGGNTLELPQSELIRTRAYAWFAVHLLAQADRLQAMYNDAVDRYRHDYRVRSAAHPAPNLASSDHWFETPFWIWTADDQRRRPLFARAAVGRIELTDRGGFYRCLRRRSIDDLTGAVEQFLQMLADGVVVQTRALTTTLFARLVLGDLFLHGIGGAKYDRATDRLMRGFFPLEPPHYLVVSASKPLPIEFRRSAPGALAAVRKRLHSMQYHPETFLTATDQLNRADQSAVADLIAAKRRWIQEIPTRAQAKRRYQELRALNESLQQYLSEQRQALIHDHAALRHDRRRAALLGARDYSFVLYPEKTLAEFFRDSAVASL